MSEKGISYDDTFDILSTDQRPPSTSYVGAKSKCLRFKFCSNLEITTEICEEKGNKLLRCNQGQFALIQLISRQHNNKK